MSWSTPQAHIYQERKKGRKSRRELIRGEEEA